MTIDNNGGSELVKLPHIVVKYDKGRLVAGTPPTVHEDYDSALREAKRLAQKFPDTVYCVFGHVASCVTQPNPLPVVTITY